MNYKNVPNVEYARFENDNDEPDPDVEGTARIDEMYVDSGQLYLGLSGPEAFHSIKIPVLRGKGWGAFVRSLVKTLR